MKHNEEATPPRTRGNPAKSRSRITTPAQHPHRSPHQGYGERHPRARGATRGGLAVAGGIWRHPRARGATATKS